MIQSDPLLGHKPAVITDITEQWKYVSSPSFIRFWKHRRVLSEVDNDNSQLHILRHDLLKLLTA